jgi:hypothetical protein
MQAAENRSRQIWRKPHRQRCGFLYELCRVRDGGQTAFLNLNGLLAADATDRLLRK